MEMKLADWLTQYNPNVVNLACLPGGEDKYLQVQAVIRETVPATPLRMIQVHREYVTGPNSRIKIMFNESNISREDLFLSDLTLLVDEKGMIIPIRTTTKSPSGILLTL